MPWSGRDGTASSGLKPGVSPASSRSNVYPQSQSKWAPFPGGGGYHTVEVAIGAHPKWTGTSTGLRIDPLDSNESFGIADVCVGADPANCALHWSFDGADQVSSPFFGRTLHGIGALWTDGDQWGGNGIAGDPFFQVTLDFDCAL